ncbi:MAG: BON domain-containing protein [Bacteroidetes bacterium]|nr:hypothetical protein AWN76_004280 [Rhodothermaceae bacterium RA]RMH58027.1 MAG: BON domain-containing protein [Bacteroidota bacterium]
MIGTRFRSLARRLRGRPPRDHRMTLKDEQLARRLYRTFEHDLALADVQGIHFYVQNGIVTLYGVVRHDLDRELLVSLVEDLPGVEGVVEHLQVVAEPFQDTEPAAPRTPSSEDATDLSEDI